MAIARWFMLLPQIALFVLLLCYIVVHNFNAVSQYAILVMHTNGTNTSTSDLYLCQTALILYLYLHLHSSTFKLAMLLKFSTTCNNTSINSDTHTQH